MSKDEQKFGWQIREWCKGTGVGRTKAYQFMAEGQIEFVKVGARTIITTHPADFLARYASKVA
jgi:hypothetical protein